MWGGVHKVLVGAEEMGMRMEGVVLGCTLLIFLLCYITLNATVFFFGKIGI